MEETFSFREHLNPSMRRLSPPPEMTVPERRDSPKCVSRDTCDFARYSRDTCVKYMGGLLKVIIRGNCSFVQREGIVRV